MLRYLTVPKVRRSDPHISQLAVRHQGAHRTIHLVTERPKAALIVLIGVVCLRHHHIETWNRRSHFSNWVTRYALRRLSSQPLVNRTALTAFVLDLTWFTLLITSRACAQHDWLHWEKRVRYQQFLVESQLEYMLYVDCSTST